MVLTLKYLFQKLKSRNHKNEEIDLYGIIGQQNTLYILSGILKSHQLTHDPALLLPSPLNLIGKFSTEDKSSNIKVSYSNNVFNFFVFQIILYDLS